MVDLPNTPRRRGEYDAPTTPVEEARTILLNQISWGAVLAGVVVALVTQLILNLLGLGVGASTLDPAAGPADNPSATEFSIGAGIWWAIAGIIASFAGGYAAGRLAGRPTESTAGWHGLTAWAFTTLLIFYLLTSTFGGIISGAYRTLADATGTIATAAAQAAISRATDPFASIERSLRDATGGNDRAALRDAAVAAMRALVTGDQNQAQQARDRAAQALAQAENIPIEQGQARVQQYEQQYRQAVENARQQAQRAANAVATGALFSAIALILGAIAAWFGGRMGTVEPTVMMARFSRPGR